VAAQDAKLSCSDDIVTVVGSKDIFDRESQSDRRGLLGLRSLCSVALHTFFLRYCLLYTMEVMEPESGGDRPKGAYNGSDIGG
jgi:hypothetical protein